MLCVGEVVETEGVSRQTEVDVVLEREVTQASYYLGQTTSKQEPKGLCQREAVSDGH